MNYFSILKARRKGGKVPTLEQRQWSGEQQMRLAEGRCIQCGERPASLHSYICAVCQADDTIEEIHREIKALRNRLLHHQEE